MPDGALHRNPPEGVWSPTAALVIEVVFPNDETWEKLPFYAAHDVDEVLIVDPRKRGRLAGPAGGEYERVERSQIVELGAQELAEQLTWPGAVGEPWA